MLKIKLNKRYISNKTKTYFIADIAANHNGSLSKAKKLIRLCAKAGADCAKFQHFKAETTLVTMDLRKLKDYHIKKNGKKCFRGLQKQASIQNGLKFYMKNAKEIKLIL